MALTIRTTGFEEYLDPNGGAWVKTLVLGEHGVGKTPLAACWPKPIFADCEKGMMSVANKAVPYAPITSSADFEALLMHVKADSMKPVERRQYGTFVVDTINSLQRVLIAERLRKERREQMIGLDWGWLGSKMTGYLESMLNLNMNLVVLMHVKDEKDTAADGETPILIKKNALKGDLAYSIYRDFDLIGYMESYYAPEGGERVLKRQIRWESEPKFPMIRDRSGKLPRFTDVDFTEGDYQRIFDAIFSDLESLPSQTEVTELETETDEGEVAPADLEGGPVENPSVPKAPAKKAAAKKAAPAKKAAAKKPEPKPEPEPKAAEPEPEKGDDPWAPPAEATGVDTTDAAALLEKELGATTVSEEDHKPMALTQPKAEEPKAEEPKAEATATHVCGDAKPGLTAKVDGCGAPLTAANGSKVQIARLKYHTDLCEDCFARHKAA